MPKIIQQSAFTYDPSRKLPWDFVYSTREKGAMCKVKFCRNIRPVTMRPNGREYTEPICDRCKYRRWRANNPEKCILKELRRRAKDRNIPFTLTVDQLPQIEGWSDYLQRRGNNRESLQIDRIKTHLGYTLDNVRIITTTENTCKGNRERHESSEQIDIPW